MPEVTPPDTRIYFAAERTLLAWVRTGISVMAFGFVVARFGLFLRLLDQQQGGAHTHAVTPWVGAALVLLGVATTEIGALRFQRYAATLPQQDMPWAGVQTAPIVLTQSFVLAGLVLAWALVS